MNCWRFVARKNNIEVGCRKTINLFESLHHSLIDNSAMVLQRPADQRKKLAVLDKIVTSQIARRNAAFKNWRTETIKRSFNKRVGN